MLNFGISPCPNDIFIFYAMIRKKIELAGLKLNFLIEDVETLNKLCLNGELDISKVSTHVYYYIKDNYEILKSGGAFSEEGPVLVAKDLTEIEKSVQIKIALPGRFTTATAIMWFYWKKHFLGKKYILRFVPFNEIIDKLIKNEVQMGVLIHEGRFIYQNFRLKLIADLGEFWKKQTNSLIPLGCIVAKKSFPEKTLMEHLITESILYSRNHLDEVLPFIKKYAQELDDDVIISHIKTYVNDYSLDLGEKGMKSIIRLMDKIHEEGLWK